MSEFVWLEDRPEDDDILWDMLCNKKHFSTWMVLDSTYKVPQAGMQEFIFCDGSVRTNSPGYRANARESIKWALYTIENGTIEPRIMTPEPKEITEKVSKFTSDDWVRLLKKHDWRPVFESEPLGSPYFFDRRDGKTVYKHPKWAQFVVIGEHQWRSKIASFCLAESIDIRNIMDCF
jgi:hypothetical protein